jgi:hypothetical protein
MRTNSSPDPRKPARRFAGVLIAVVVVASSAGGGCECFQPFDEPGLDTPNPPDSARLSGCVEPSDWLGKSCAVLCTSIYHVNDYPGRCVEDGCASAVAGYRIWDACYFDRPPEAIFPLELDCGDVLDESLLTDYHYISCCCEQYEATSDSGSESG